MSALPEMLKHSPLAVEIHAAFRKDGAFLVCGADGAAKSWILSSVFEKRPMIMIVPERKDIAVREQDLRFFLPDVEILPFPIVETADFSATHTGTEALRGRMRALAALVSEKPCIILATAVEATQYLPHPKTFLQGQCTVRFGDTIERDDLIETLVKAGYERTVQVERPGHFAVRGDIVDVFTINDTHPYRIEFFDNVIDGLRIFDEDTQRSVREVKEMSVFPVSVESGTSFLTEYVGNGCVVFDEPQRAEAEQKKFLREEKGNRTLVGSWQDLTKSSPRALVFSSLHRSFPEFKKVGVHTWEGETATEYQRQFSLFAEEVKIMLRDGWQVSVVVPNDSEKKEIGRYLRAEGLSVAEEESPNAVKLVSGLIGKGFLYRPLKTAVFAAGDLLGRSKIQRKLQKSSHGKPLRFFSELEEGDYVVQRVHGIGRYLGLKTIELDGIHRDYMTIQYADGDKLYLPMEKITSLEKYIGPEGTSPALSKMGGVQWEKVRNRAKKSIEDMAEKLLDIYAKREITPGIAFLPDTEEQLEFEDSFPYVETPDQADAIEKIKRAMEKSEPMDMLLCGDVGFGKTEVAMRAVFKCVMSGYQSIVMAPTTVLTQQHFNTFSERMERFGITVRCLNRFVTPKEKKEILNGFAMGQIDVLIGTHAILSKQIKSAKLGLLVVDEEQRFGVAQKEKWKSRESGIDILTLSATPIPRTLHMSLTGVRDMATITQPPANRHAIQTYVTEYDDEIVKEAILREKERGGQTYFIYNRIDTLDAMASHLRLILPETVSIGVAHGRMTGDSLEQVMIDFFRGKYDVLLCTTIVENGVDQPNANTMIVYDADRMGLSQLYQMRGRVGRSDKIARAYFFYRRGKILTEVAEKRLNTIREFTELGAGFKIAMRDLEIRGAGNLLGSAQHGNIAAVGFATYCTMLDAAIRKLKAERAGEPLPKSLPRTRIEFTGDAYLDDAYIKKPELKIEIYRRLADVSTQAELRDLLDEVIDRFGTPSVPAEKLFAVARLRVLAQHLGIGSIVSEGESVMMTWADEEPLKNFHVMELPPEFLYKIHILPQSPLRVTMSKASITGDLQKWLYDFLTAVRENSEKHGG